MGETRGIPLPAVAARYYPPSSGKYEVKPGLMPLGTDYGNGAADGLTFQCDAGFAVYRKVKQAARRERLGKYYQIHEISPEISGAVCRFIARRLAEEHPGCFALDERGREMALRCGLTGETLRFDPEMRTVSGGDADPPYADPFDALAAQVQEDLAVVRRVDGKDWACAIHLCFPYRWTAEEKIGMDFVTMHLPVPGMETFRKPGMVTNMIKFGPFTRFVWELCTDARLNHHREPPPGVDPTAWHERPFDPQHPRLFLRVEREVLWGFPDLEAALLAVRVSFRDGEEIRNEATLREPLCQAIESMPPEALRYKGLEHNRDHILAWLRS
ncbi:MAG TPA: heme-dependent oxidative N-demethylase subunit alpha family protein [Gemmatimonadales bacterium]|nr:heme-dependent oxidative N-demethylase subunit alpha family protein [Gemmatimonadales bacterium]